MKEDGLAVRDIKSRELREVCVCYGCNDKQWREFDTGWMSLNVAVIHRLEGHDVERIEVIPDEGIISLR